jgi:hypothetical protein
MITFVPSYIVSCEKVNPIIENKWSGAEINPKASYYN